MKLMRPTMMIAALAVVATPVLADPGGKGHGNKFKNHGQSASFCPPGLAKKGNGCRPPGLAKKDRHHDDHYREVRRDRDRDHDRYDHDRYRYRVGDRIVNYDNVILIRDPGRYGLDPYGTYYRADDYVIRVDRKTNQVMALVGLVTAILGG